MFYHMSYVYVMYLWLLSVEYLCAVVFYVLKDCHMQNVQERIKPKPMQKTRKTSF